MIPWNIKYPTQNGEMINLDWIISEVKRPNQNLDELEARVLAAALAATKEYVDVELATIREEFADLQNDMVEMRNYFDSKVSELQSDYNAFTNQVNQQIILLTNRIADFDQTIKNDIIGVNALTDLKIQQNNEYILSEVAKGVVNVKVYNYFTGELVTVQQMFNTLAELHLENPISYTELAAASITYADLAALNMTYTELAIKGNSFINP
jgi:hypothetical protein